MIEFSPNDLATHTAHIQRLAQNHPVMISDNQTKQILMTYDDYLKLGGEPQPPFESAYEFFVKSMNEHFSQEELAILAEMDFDADMSNVEQK